MSTLRPLPRDLAHACHQTACLCQGLWLAEHHELRGWGGSRALVSQGPQAGPEPLNFQNCTAISLCGRCGDGCCRPSPHSESDLCAPQEKLPGHPDAVPDLQLGHFSPALTVLSLALWSDKSKGRANET